MKAKREKSPPEAVAANTEIKQEIYELAHEELSAQTDAEIVPFIQNVAATSIAELAHEELSAQVETDAEIAPLIQKVGATSIAERPAAG